MLSPLDLPFICISLFSVSLYLFILHISVLKETAYIGWIQVIHTVHNFQYHVYLTSSTRWRHPIWDWIKWKHRRDVKGDWGRDSLLRLEFICSTNYAVTQKMAEGLQVKLCLFFLTAPPPVFPIPPELIGNVKPSDWMVAVSIATRYQPLWKL